MINGNPDISAYDPLTGKLMWSVPGLTGDVAPSLAYNSKLVYAVTDYAKLMAVTPGKSAPPVWEDNAYTPDVSSPAANEDYLFLTTGNGDVACYDAIKGDTLWTRYLINSFYASPIICDEKVWMLDRSGMMHIAAADKNFKLLGTPSIGEVADCTPAFSEGSIFIRAKKNLYCISSN
jgi:outer membrane protein assembly factor BamB